MSRVYVIDDAPFMIDLICGALSDSSYHVVGTSTEVQRAEEEIAALKPEVLILDLVLPQRNGVQFASDIFKVLPNVHVLALSSLDSEQVLSQLENAGVRAFLQKPFTKKELISELDRLPRMYREVKVG